MEQYQEFVGKLQKRGSKPHKISHCLGSRDAWKWVRKNKWEALHGEPFDQLLYSKIINEVDKYLVESLFEGHEIEFPHQMGGLILLKNKPKVALEGDKIKDNYLVDWKKTLEYWYEHPEARETHRPIKRVSNELFYILYTKKKAVYSKKRFYNFRINRSMLRTLGRLIETRKINACNI